MLNLQSSRNSCCDTRVRRWGCHERATIGLSFLGCWRDGDRLAAPACGSLIILSSFIRRRKWHEDLEIDMFRKMIAYGLLHRGAEWLRAPASDELPHGPPPLHGSVSHWPLTSAHLSFLPLVSHHHLDGLEYRP